MAMLDPGTELSRFLDGMGADFAGLIKRMARAMVDGRMDPENAAGIFEKHLAEMMALADIQGRRRVHLECDAATGGRKWSKMADFVPRVSFKEQAADIAARLPDWSEGQNWRDIADKYQSEHVFAAVRSSSLEVTERVQKAIDDLIVGGQPQATANAVLREIDGWADAYAETVFRTNAATAYSRGRMEEAQRPLVREAMPAWERFSMQDRDVRDNHAAAHGLIAATDDPIWLQRVDGGPAMVPSGYNCRCSLRLVDREELEQRGLLRPDGTVRRHIPRNFYGVKGKSGYYPDPGFETKFGG